MTDPTPELEDALRNLGAEAPLPNRERAAVRALARHRVPDLDGDLHRAAVEYATVQDHGRDHLMFDQIVNLRVTSPLLRDAIAYTAAQTRQEVRRLRDDNARLERQNAAAMRLLRKIVVPAGQPHLVVALADVRLALGSSSGAEDLIDKQWEAISQQAPGHPEETTP